MVGSLDSTTHPLRAARLRERYTLRQLAERTGVHFTRIHAIELGARPSQIEARLLRAALGLPLSALLPGVVGSDDGDAAAQHSQL